MRCKECLLDDAADQVSSVVEEFVGDSISAGSTVFGLEYGRSDRVLGGEVLDHFSPSVLEILIKDPVGKWL
eukprot:9443998-Prorocentrum_lima.AAC.1